MKEGANGTGRGELLRGLRQYGRLRRLRRPAVCVNARILMLRHSVARAYSAKDLEGSGRRLIDVLSRHWVGVRFSVGSRNFCLLHVVQTYSGAHLASYPMDTGASFPGSKATVE
jgi:hypothetical protein